MLRSGKSCIRLWCVVGTSAVIAVAESRAVHAQGLTTAAIRGTVATAASGRGDGARVTVVDSTTGYSSETRVRSGQFLVQGIPPGGPYRLVVRLLGYSPHVVDGLILKLGETREVEVRFSALATLLDTARITAAGDHPPSATGVGASISNVSLRRLPSLNRDMYEFVRLVPQASTRFGPMGAASFRFNSYVIDGVSDRQLQGNNVLGTGATGGRSISLDAVQEYQVLISPYEARYGEFVGLLVNAITKRGTNELRGSAYGYMRNESFSRTNSFVGSSPFRREQFGFSLGGPVIRDRLHFFIAPEFQHSSSPSPGPFIGQKPGVSPAVPVLASDVERFASLLKLRGLDAGNGGRVTSLNPATSVFARLDLAVPEWKSRIMIREDFSSVDLTRFVRSASPTTFALTSNAFTLRTSKNASAVQIFTQLSSTVFNEFQAARMDRPLLAREYAHFPSILASVPSVSGPSTVFLVAGPPLPAGGAGASQVFTEISDHLSFQLGSSHSIEIGSRVEVFDYYATGVRGGQGQWRFASLDALASGDASSYTITKDFGSAQAPVRGTQPSAYLGDDWHVGDRLLLTVGLRVDLLDLSSVPAYSSPIDSMYSRRTSDYPSAHPQWSPRFGFRWDPFQGHQALIRGGAGVFVGPPPLGWLLGPLRSNGDGVRTLTCPQQGLRNVPKFVSDPSAQPQTCSDGAGFSDGPVALVDKRLKMPEAFRASLALDGHLPFGIGATLEGLYSRMRSDFLFVNADLAGPQGVDSHGRVLYGSIDGAGRASPKLISNRRFPEVIDLRNHSLGHSWSLTGQLERPFENGLGLRASYTYSRVRDVQSLTNGSAVNPYDTWATGRPIAGRHDDLKTGVSSFEIPHRVILAMTYTAPWRRWNTGFSLYYIGESGSPFTYGDSASDQSHGDLNADGTSMNDPVYIPRDATNPSEIAFGGSDVVLQAAALERFISQTPCLRRQRGKIVERNSCHGPWVNTSNAALTQSLQANKGHDLSLRVEAFNVLNLLNSSWGLFRVPNTTLLQHVGQTPGTPSQPVFHFDSSSARSSTQNIESGYQLQLSLRYTF